jgi:hypothetical protein
MMRYFLIIAAIAALVSCSKSKPDDDTTIILGSWNPYYTPELTSVVSVYNNQNILVRGSHPIDQQKKFVYDQIISAVKAQQPSIDLAGYTLVDVSMIDNRPDGDMPNLNNELIAFGLDSTSVPDTWPPFEFGYSPALLGTTVNTHPGHFLWWPLEGYNPNNSVNQRVGQFITGGTLGYTWGFNFNGMIDRIDSLLKDTSVKRIIYYHCTWGKDRTGALTFGWLYKYGGLSYDSAIAKVLSISPVNEHYTVLMNDYKAWVDSTSHKKK